MAIAGELINILGFKLEGEKNLKKFKSEMDKAERDADKAAANAQRRGKAIGTAIGAGTLVAAATIKKAYLEYATFERGLTRIGITAGATRKETAALGAKMYQMAQKFAMPIENVQSGLDVLTASGKNLKEAMDYLPSVLATAQASGAAVEDIANTAIKTSSALGIGAEDLQYMFDILNTGGKLGQFELKDMATYLPILANQFAALGYEGTDGVKKLVAMLQVLREDTGSAENAATQARDLFAKMYSPQIMDRFKKEFDIDLRKEMDARIAKGQDTIESFIDIVDKAIGGDTSRLSEIFSEQDSRMAVLSLLTSRDQWKEMNNALGGADIAGSSMRDLNTVLADQDAILQRLVNRWGEFMKNLGGATAGPIGAVLDKFNNYLSFENSLEAGREKLGKSRWETFFNTPGGNARIARAGGYAPTLQNQRDMAQAPHAYEVLGRMPVRPNPTVGRATATHTADGVSLADPFGDGSGAYGTGPQAGSVGGVGTIQNMLAGMNAHLAQMTANAVGDATITDARVDARDMSLNVGAPVVTVTVQAPAAAAGQVGAQIGNAVGNAITQQQGRIQQEPSE